MSVALRIQKLNASAKLPEKKDSTDAGIDIFTNETHTLKPGEIYAFSTGIATSFPKEYVALIWDRSGLGVTGIHRLAGVIDSGYRGEWKIVLVNLSKKSYKVVAGDKIAQCVFQKFEPTRIREVKNLSTSKRGTKGFGSSGK